nr:DUF2157 domain-containing protein [uncultured Dethiosulfovibrio sp.]
MGERKQLLRIGLEDLDVAQSMGLIDGTKREDLEAFLIKASEARGDGSRLVSFAYYLGAMMVISALTWFVADAWDFMSGLGLAAVALIYGLGFGFFGYRFYRRDETRTLGGLLVTIAVCLTPMLVYGLQKETGLWTGEEPGNYSDFYRWIKSGWCLMEISTIGAVLLAMRWIRFSFLAFPLALSLWFTSMDISPLLSVDRRVVSMVFGFAMGCVALRWDMGRDQGDPEYGFWLHLFGALAFWGGLTLLDSRGEFSRMIYGTINLGLMLLSLALDRSIYMTLGAIGFFGYLGHLAWSLFADFFYFPFVLVAFGLVVMFCGLWYSRRKLAIEKWVAGRLPRWLLRLREVRGDSAWR